MKSKLPSMLMCPSCQRMRPISEMSIDKRFRRTDEPRDRQHTRIVPEVSEAPPNSAWQIRCNDCDPRRGGYFWFSLDQCDTPAKALDSIMQLNEECLSPIVIESFINLIEHLFGRGTMIEN